MKIIKDDQLSILYRVFGYRGTETLSVAVLAGFALDKSGRLLDEADLWDRAGAALGRSQVLDLAMPKPKAEALALAKCYAPPGKKVQGAEASFQVGPIEKRVHVLGDRYHPSGWLSARHMEPEPFSEMDICWENAFGGPKHEVNPCGKGMVPVQTEGGEKMIPLPNIHDQGQLTSSPGDRPRPAGLGPMGLDWPARLKNLGTFDHKWFVDRWPGLPDDFDFGYFNLAPEDQRMEGWFKGNEDITVTGMHPETSRITSRLPGLRCRLFIRRRHRDLDKFLEAPVRADTVYLIPHLEAGLLIWHGTIAVADDEAEDVSHLVAFHEPLDEEPRPAEYYQAKLAEPVEKEPVDELPPPDESVSADATEPVAAEADSGTTGEAPAAAPVAAAVPLAEASEAATPEEPAETPPAEEGEPPEPQGLTRERVLAGRAAGESLAGQDLTGLDLSDCDLSQIDLTDAVLENVNFSRSDLSQARMSGSMLTGAHLTGCRLGRADLSGVQASGVKMAGADLTEANLASADFTAADLAGACLREADLTLSLFNQAVLTGADCSLARAEQTRFEQADLKGARFVETDLPEADLTGANLEEADFSRAKAADLRLYGVSGRGVNFQGAHLVKSRVGENASLPGSDFSQADVSASSWEDADLTESDFSGANLKKAQINRCRFDQARLSLADAQGTDFSKCDFSGADMKALNLLGGSFRKARLTEADLRGANLYGVDFYKSILGATRLEEANLDRTLLAERLKD